MSYTNRTPNYDLPQWIGTDKPTFLGDFNGAFSAIDTAMKNNEDAAAAAVGTANAASATATSANTNANTALNTANTAKTSADAATAAAASATSTANSAQTTANAAARTAQANNIENLAPAYDPTLTYNVGDLVTYVDAQNSGKLYKCIIAVNTPMEFNVNYWDDVTVSEILKSVSIYYAEADGSSSMKERFHAMMLALKDTKFFSDPYTAARTRLYRVKSDGTVNFFQLEDFNKGVSTFYITYFRTAGVSSPNAKIFHSIFGGNVAGNNEKYTNIDLDSNGLTVNDYTDVTDTDGLGMVFI